MSTSAHTIQKSEWEVFLAGQWQKEQPTKPGTYETATRDGYAGSKVTIMNDGTVIGSSTDNWQGWWWSEPTPRMPKPPTW